MSTNNVAPRKLCKGDKVVMMIKPSHYLYATMAPEAKGTWIEGKVEIVTSRGHIFSCTKKQYVINGLLPVSNHGKQDVIVVRKVQQKSKPTTKHKLFSYGFDHGQVAAIRSNPSRDWQIPGQSVVIWEWDFTTKLCTVIGKTSLWPWPHLFICPKADLVTGKGKQVTEEIKQDFVKYKTAVNKVVAKN